MAVSKTESLYEVGAIRFMIADIHIDCINRVFVLCYDGRKEDWKIYECNAWSHNYFTSSCGYYCGTYGIVRGASKGR